MTPAEVLDLAAVAGCEVYLRETDQPAVRGSVPNAALLAALKEHRAGIIALLKDEPVTCGECRALVREAVDGVWWCDRSKCPMRRGARR